MPLQINSAAAWMKIVYLALHLHISQYFIRDTKSTSQAVPFGQIRSLFKIKAQTNGAFVF